MCGGRGDGDVEELKRGGSGWVTVSEGEMSWV